MDAYLQARGCHLVSSTLWSEDARRETVWSAGGTPCGIVRLQGHQQKSGQREDGEYATLWELVQNNRIMRRFYTGILRRVSFANEQVPENVGRQAAGSFSEFT